MHGFRLGKTNLLAGQALDSCSEQQVLVLDILGVPFADRVLVERDQLGIAAPVVVEKDEVVATVEHGERFSAKHGKIGFRCNFPFHSEWNGKTYSTKQIEAYAVEEEGSWLVITVITKFF